MSANLGRACGSMVTVPSVSRSRPNFLASLRDRWLLESNQAKAYFDTTCTRTGFKLSTNTSSCAPPARSACSKPLRCQLSSASGSARIWPVMQTAARLAIWDAGPKSAAAAAAPPRPPPARPRGVCPIGGVFSTDERWPCSACRAVCVSATVSALPPAPTAYLGERQRSLAIAL
eukprot:scaffold45381_cov71-Phaeocystis_antarctica.AAC.2